MSDGHLALQEIQEFLKRKRGILLAYVFGSQAAGSAGPLSDLDLAVLPDDADAGIDLPSLQTEIMEIARRRELDLVDLRTAPPLLQFEVVSSGQLLFARDDDVLNRFERAALLRYMDTQHLRDVQNQYLREHLLGAPSPWS